MSISLSRLSIRPVSVTLWITATGKFTDEAIESSRSNFTIRFRISTAYLITSSVLFSWVPVIDYIESKYEEFLNAESRVTRRQIPDSRVHCCLYFVAPSGHGLKPLDVEFMQRLHDKVNIIPVIAKADTMTPDECAHFKKQVRRFVYNAL